MLFFTIIRLMKYSFLRPVAAAAAALSSCILSAHATPPKIELSVSSSVIVGGAPRPGAAEIVAYDAQSKRLFIVNAPQASVDVVDITDPAQPSVVSTLDMTPYGAVANSVAVHEGLIAIAVEAAVNTDPGKVVFFDRTLEFVAEFTVGALPDMVTFTPNGRYVVAANEGEPSADYSVDPEGSVSIIDLTRGVAKATVATADFKAFTPENLDPAVRIFGPNATVAQDLEPEYITISGDSKTAWVSLQENNAFAVVDLRKAKVTKILPLGSKDYSAPGNGLDASDRDGVINIQPWPVRGLFLPDAIAAYRVGGRHFIISANEGDSREYSTFVEEVRIGSSSVVLDPTVFPNAADLKTAAQLGRLKITTTQGDRDGDGDYDELYSFGTRSFSIWTTDGRLVWDSGDAIEQITAEAHPGFFNASNSNNTFDDRSDDKGPEPEAVAVGRAFGRQYAFIGLERIGGLMVYDVSRPKAPTFVQYINNRDFTKTVGTVESGDQGPEGLLFIEEKQSPNGKPLLVVANEVSGSTTIYQIDRKPAPPEEQK
jgi:hypothetical protein